MNKAHRPKRDTSDPAKNQMAIILGFLIIGISLCCCLVTLLGWTRGALNVLG